MGRGQAPFGGSGGAAVRILIIRREPAAGPDACREEELQEDI